MIYRKYLPQKRSGVIICPAEMEDLSGTDISDDTVITILRDKYNLNFFELPPYHYIVSDNGVTPIKSLNLQHSDESHLRSFNDDIKVLLLKNQLLFTKQEEIAKLISDMSESYCFKISSDTIFAKADASINETTQMEEIIKLAIKIRNEKNPTMAVCEAIINDNIIINDSVSMVNNKCCFTNLSQFANQYSVPVSIIEALNPHLRDKQLIVTDVVFVPNTIAYKGITYGNSCKKTVQYLYDRATRIIEGVM